MFQGPSTFAKDSKKSFNNLLSRRSSFASATFDACHDYSDEISNGRSTNISNYSTSENNSYVQVKSNKQLYDKLGVSFQFENLNECVASLLKKSKEEMAFGRDIKKR